MLCQWMNFFKLFIECLIIEGCVTLWSDDAQTFKAASREIKQLFGASLGDSAKVWKKIDESKFKSELASKGIK